MTAPMFNGTQACAGADTDLFFPSRGNVKASIRAAKELCSSCPVREPCLDYAVWAQGVPGRFVAGVWGGTTEEERARIRQAHREAA